jgi:hypothetical protein
MRKKKLWTVFLLAAGMGLSHSSSAIKITFGTKCHPDDNGGCAGDRGICVIIEIRNAEQLVRSADPSTLLGDDMAYGDLVRIDENRFRLDILSQRSDVPLSPLFTVEQPVELRGDLPGRFGVQSLVIRPGQYQVDYSRHMYGSVILQAAVR